MLTGGSQVIDDRSQLGTTYNYVLAKWKTGFRAVSDAPPTVIAAIEKSLSSQAVSSNHEAIRSSYDDETRLCILSVQSSYPPDTSGLTVEGSPSFVHAIATNELQLDDLSTDNLQRLFESVYGCPVLPGIKQRQEDYSQIDFPENRESAQSYFVLRQHLAKCFPTQAPSSSLPLSSLLTFSRSTSNTIDDDPIMDTFTLRKGVRGATEIHVPPTIEEAKATSSATSQLPPTAPTPASSFSQPRQASKGLAAGLLQLAVAATLGSLLGAGLLLAGLFFFSPQGAAIFSSDSPPVIQQATPSDPLLESVQKQAVLLKDTVEDYKLQLDVLREEVKQAILEKPLPATPEGLAASTAIINQPNPPGLFEIQIRNSSFLRPIPSIEGNEPKRILQNKERHTVTAVISQSEGTWYEIRRGWIRKSSRTLEIDPGRSTPALLQADYPGLFEVQIQQGVNIYSIPNRKRVEGVQRLEDQSIHTVIDEYEAEDGTWLAIRYGWVKKTPRTSMVKRSTRKSARATSPDRAPDF